MFHRMKTPALLIVANLAFVSVGCRPADTAATIPSASEAVVVDDSMPASTDMVETIAVETIVVEPVAVEPVAVEPVVVETTSDKTTADKAMADKAATDKAAADKAAADKAADQKAADKKAADKKAVVEKAVADKAAAKKAADEKAAADKKTAAVCVLEPIADSGVKGTLNFVQVGKKVTLTGEITGLTPGEHGFHVHEKGDLSDKKTGNSAGGHFNPAGHKHGKPDDAERHAGDLGNITADDKGVAKIDIHDEVISLNGDNSIVGKSIVVHESVDKFTQPTGDAGGRVAFGLIEAKK